MLPKETTLVKSLREQVYEYLFAQMRQKALDPGGFLDLNEIAATLGISRTPLRDALIYLEVEGYVETIPRRGVRVKYLKLDEIKEIYQIIGALEATALLAAARRFRPEDLQHLQALTEDYHQQLELASFEGCLEANYRFHDYFLDQAGNPSLARMVRAQKRRLYDWPRSSTLNLQWERNNVEEHEKIVALLRAGDAPGAAAWLKDVHWSFPVQEEFIQPFYSGTAE